MKLRNKNKSIGRALIDLTPLLDVIFIFLVVVLCFNTNENEEAQAKLSEAKTKFEEAERIEEEAETKLGIMQDHLNNYAEDNDNISFVTIYAEYTPNDRKFRTIHVRVNEQEDYKIPLNPSNTDDAWTECKDYILKFVDQEKPMMVSIMNTKMLYRDEQKIEHLIDELNDSGEGRFYKSKPRNKE